MAKINTNGIEIEYFECGSGEPIIFVHGASLDASFYDITASMLEHNFKVITYNRRGYQGSSRYSETGTIDNQVEDLKGLIDGLNLKKVHLNGHSAGGAVSIAFAIKYPERVQTLALLDPMLWQSMPIAEEIIQLFGGVGEKYQKEGVKSAMYHMWEMMCGSDVHQRMPKGGFERIIENAGTCFLELGAFVQWKPSRQDISALKMPVLTVIGTVCKTLHRVYRVYQEQVDLVKECIPHTIEYTLPNATHLLFIENPSDFAVAIKNFLKKHS